MPLLLLGAAVLGGFSLKSMLPSADSDHPIRDLTNLIVVGGAAYIGYRMFVRR